MINLKFLGRGSAFNTKEFSNSSFFVMGDTLFLFDCGDSTFSRIREFNLFDNIILKTVILITHLHP